MMQQHPHQQQLAALLTSALPKKDDKKPDSSDDDSSSRLSAINSLHRAILYPPNSLLVTHSASFLAQGFSQLLIDKSYHVRHAAATAYGALCSVLCSISISPNGRQNHVLLGNLIDRFIAWSLPCLRNNGNPNSELSLESLREFLNVGEVGAVERFALPILKACQELLEDDRTSMTLLPRILGLLTLVSLKFFRCFQPHFVDIVDLLLGWAMVPDISEADKRVIMDSFLQFQKHWVNNLQFSLGLLSKFLDDMDMLLQDGGSGTPQQFKRLLALLSCFCTVLQSVASGLLEINYLEQISEPLSQMVPLLLRCLSMVGRKFGWLLWIEDSWRCLTLLAEILGDKFSAFYSTAVDILFQSLAVDNNNNNTQRLPAFKVHGVLKTNLQLLSLQKLGLMTSSVDKILQFDGAISQLRLHPNHLVTGSAAATYIFLLQHGKNDIAEKAMDSLIEEIHLLKHRLEKDSGKGDELEMTVASKLYSVSELAVLIKFNLKVLLSCVVLPGAGSLIWQVEIDSLYLRRVEKLVKLITDGMGPFELPILGSVELQVNLIRTLERLSSIEFMRKCSIRKQKIKKSSPETSSSENVEDESLREIYPSIIFGHLKRYSEFLIRALDSSSPMAVKIEALKWMHKFCEGVIIIYTNIPNPIYPCQAVECCKTIQDLLFSTLIAASDREPKVRSLVATVLDALLSAKIIHPIRFPIISETILEKLGDPDKDIKSTYLKLLSHVLPLTIYVCGLTASGATISWQPHFRASVGCTLHWKQVFALKQLAQQLHSQQLVTVLNFISQRWKVPLSSWIQQLILSCHKKNDHTLIQPEETGMVDHNRLWCDIKVEDDFVESVCSVNLVAGAWWAIHEAARFCITTRLRTNLGGPTQTFAALERMLRDIAHVLQLETEQNDIGSHAHLLPMRLLLEFVESLKKKVYNAYEGSTVFVHAPQASSLFFRANKKVCEEWFSRINEPMMDAGMALQCHDATVHYCALRLQDFSNHVSSAMSDKSRAQASENIQNLKSRYGGDLLRIARNMSLALCKKQEPEALLGLQKWLTIAFSPLFSEENQVSNSGNFSWMTGLLYQARSHHEKAAAHFIHLLQDEESLSSMGSDGIQFIIARIIESYTAISDWKSLETWLTELQSIRGKYAGKSYAGALTTAGNELNAIQALACFDEDDFQSAWSYLDLTPKSSSELTLDPRLALQRSEQMILQAMLHHAEGKAEKVAHELQKAKSMLEEIFSVLALDGLVEAAPHINQLYCISAFEEGCKLGDSQGQSYQSLLGTYIQNMQFPCNRVHQDCSSWLKVLRVYQRTLPTSPMTLELCRNLMILARKQRNLALATRLNNYLKCHASLCSDEVFRDYFIPNLEYENILLMRVENDHEGALTNLWSFLRPCMVSSSNVVSCSQNNVLMAKACLKLSNWLHSDFSGENLAGVALKMQADFNRCEISDDGVSKSRLSHIIEELVGTSRKLSTHLCPIMGKAWILYASWCYTQARASISTDNVMALRSCSFSPVLATEIQPERFVLNKEEKLRVKEIVSKFIPEMSEEELLLETRDCDISSDLKPLLQKIIDVIETAAGAPGEDCSSNSLSAAVSSQLQKCLLSSTITLDEAKVTHILGDLVDVWWDLRKRRISLFGHAAQAFINYLSNSSLKCFGGQLTGLDVDPKYKYVNYTLRAMLFVLKILVNYGVELNDTLEAALSRVPMLPWQEITPQLFAQLSSHPEKVVRRQLEMLLLMLGKLSPWSLVYPTLVDANSQEKEPSEELQKILSYLTKLYPRLVQDAQLMIRELENVTVLWEELWLGTLQDLHADVTRRVNLLKEEAARIAVNKTLNHGEKNKINAAKYSAMMAPIVVVLERRLASTSRKPETPHELWFFEEYLTPIKSAVTKFKTPPASVTMLGDVWRPFETITASLASYQRKSSISVSEVAPQLASLLSSDAPMPGLEKQITVAESESSLNQDIVTIASFSEEFVILPTKTKPKKIVIVGSDGLKYTYLLKGREDLRLDARTMQLLQAVNGFLKSSSATHGQSLGIRYYSVTPISGRAGLIQWVDNVISIYSVFKSWQNRVKMSELSASGGDGNGAVPTPVPRPSDMFYGKIIPALKEKGIRRVISRRDWPHDVKRKVLLDLMKETPKQLLQQELWCASEGFKAYSSKSKRYAGSVAAMSIVGHILGLGDRHLDNILVDFCSGDIVHIDYNVCFDKGQRLKIPEIVPFRLTQIIESALGLTGVEGTFRANCETVSGVLRKNKDIILMLLEVFVWDPLVEWTRANFHDDAAVVGEERKGMELAVSLSLFASRVQEIRVPLQEHHDLLLSTLPAVEEAIGRFSSILNQYEKVSSHFFRADQERSTLVLYETSARSVVAEATTNSEKSRLLFEMQARDLSQTQAMVMEKGREAAGWIDQHGRVLDALRNSSIPEIKVSIKLNGSEEALSLASAVISAGVPLTVVPEPTQIQCREIDREVSHLVSELDRGLSSAVGGLQMYSLALQRVLPLNYVTTSPVYSWAQVLLSLNTLSPDLMMAARKQGGELVNKGHIDGIKDVYDGLCLKVTKYVADIERLEEEHQELVASISPETESEAKERVLSAFKNYIQKDSLVDHEIERNKESILIILDTAVTNLFSDVKHRIQKSVGLIVGERNTNSGFQFDLEPFSSEFEEQIEKCLLITDFANELKRDVGLYIREFEAGANNSPFSVFKAGLQLSKNLVGKMTEVVLPSAIKSVLSFNSDVTEIFESISHIRGSLDTALEQLIHVELERISLIELESNYFVEVGRITEQQLALEEASVNGRDNLSWEEAEELASQEEACRVQLDQLHQTWNRKDLRISSLMEKESNINSTLAACELQFQSLITAEEETEPLVVRRKSLLLSLLEPFTELELVDRELIQFAGPDSYSSSRIFYFSDLINSGCSVSEYIWSFPGLVHRYAFFIWKISMVDILLGSCTHDVVSSLDQKMGFDQLVDVIKRRVRNQIQDHVIKYLKDRVATIFLSRLDRKSEMQISRQNMDFEAARRVQLMLEECCNAHKTFRAARSEASVMKRKINNIKDAFVETSLEISQMEWMYNIISIPFEQSRMNFRKFFPNDDNFLPVILNISRPKLVEAMQSSVGKIARSLEGLKSCEGTFTKAEAQLERAMSWACAGPGSARNSGIPSEFHEHLIKRRQTLQEAQENASDIMKICISILEFEASRDGIFRSTGDISALRPGPDGGIWQQNYLNALTKLDVAYHSFTRAEQEWKLAQSNMEVASNGLLSAANELSIASIKVKSASGDLQSTLVAMRDSASEASVALSAYGGIIRGHSALTSECGSMLEEVLAMTEGLADVHSLGKEAAALHYSLMEYISKASAALIPLDTMLSKDVAAMTDAMSQEKEVKLEIAPIHGQAIFQSYHNRVEETLQVFKPLVPLLSSSVKGLYSMLIRLARTASLHAGNLHKALEGLGESLQVESQEVDPLSENLSGPDVAEYDDSLDCEAFEKYDGENDGNVISVGFNEVALSDRGWISPPDSIYSASSDSGVTSSETNIANDICVNNLDTILPSSGDSDNQDTGDSKNKQESSDSEHGDEASLVNQEKLENEVGKKPLTIEAASQAHGGKNAYAMSILRRVEMKIDGRDISDNREISIAEQVDFLLRQATNIDNLCNMYEGWTPWI